MADPEALLATLRHTERAYRSLFEMTPLPVWVRDAETMRFLEVNQAAREAYGYTREEFGATLAHIAAGELPVAPLITANVGIEGVAEAFEALASPEQHAKILVEPWHA